jgi:hypothetical protein
VVHHEGRAAIRPYPNVAGQAFVPPSAVVAGRSRAMPVIDLTASEEPPTFTSIT